MVKMSQSKASTVFSLCYFSKKNQKIFSSRNRPGCFGRYGAILYSRCGLGSHHDFPGECQGLFWRDFIGGFKNLWYHVWLKMFEDLSKRKKVAYFLGRHSVYWSAFMRGVGCKHHHLGRSRLAVLRDGDVRANDYIMISLISEFCWREISWCH